MTALSIENDGPRIVASNYWDTAAAREGKLYLSTNANAFRLLVPDALAQIVGELRRSAQHVIVSQLAPEQWRDGQLCTEWLVEDGSDSPFSLHLSPGQVDRCGTAEPANGLTASVWLRGPAEVLTLPAYYRRVAKLPCLQSWSGS